MLVLTLRKEDRVIIGDPRDPLGYLVLTKIRGDQICLGIELPKDIEVHRQVIANRILENSRAEASDNSL